jgi:hypothetical protein
MTLPARRVTHQAREAMLCDNVSRMQVGPRAWSGKAGGGIVVPPELSTISDLGAPKLSFVSRASDRKVAVGVTILGSLALMGALAIVIWGPWPACAGPALLGLILTPIGVSMLVSYSRTARAVVVYDDGFAALAGKRIVRWRWRDVTDIFTDERLRTGSKTASYSHEFTFKGTYSETLVIDGSRFEDFRQLISLLKADIEPLVLARVRDPYDAGKPVTFGPVTVSKEAIVVNGQAYVWSRISNVSVNKGKLVLEREGAEPVEVEVNAIPNIEALGSLIGVDPRSMGLKLED